MQPRLVFVALIIGCNTPPGVPGIALTPVPPTTVDPLVVSVLTPAVDPDEGQELSYRYAWSVDGAPVADQSTATVPAERTARDQRWEVAVTAWDGVEEGEGAATASVTIANTVPDASVSLEPAAPSSDDDLSCLAQASDVDGDEVTLAYAWYVGGVIAGSEPTLTADATERDDSVWCEVIPDDGTNAGQPIASERVIIGNLPPAVLTLALQPETPRVADTLTADYQVQDGDGDAVELTWSWSVEGTEVGTETTLAGVFARGDTVTLTLTPADDVSSGEPVSASVVIANTAPVAQALTVAPSEPLTDDVLTAVLEASDADDDTLTHLFEWQVDGVIAGSNDTLDGATAFDKGAEISLTAWAGDGTDDSEPLSTVITVGNSPPTLAAVDLSPTSAVTDTLLTCAPDGGSDPDGDVLDYRYAWAVDGVAAGTDATLDGGSAFDKAQTVTCTITPTDGVDDGAAVSASLTVGNSPPSLAAAELSPSTANTDTSLTCVADGWSDPDGDAAGYRYAWTVDGTSAGTGATLDGDTAFDKGQVVACELTPTDGEDDGAAVSVSLTVVNTPPERPAVSLDALTPIGTDLLCAFATPADADGDSVTTAIAWAVDGVAWAGTVDTTSVSGDTIAAADVAVGELWSCIVTPEDGEDTGVTGSASTTICDPDATDSTACELVLSAGDADVILYGEGGNWVAGRRVAGAGDTDGDGSLDLLVTTNAGGGGEVFLLPGPVTATTLLSDGIALEAEATNDYAGEALAGLGDMDGDGYDDFAIDASSHDNVGAADAGRVYLFFGPVSPLSSSVADADAIILGSNASDFLGISMTGSSDMDADGIRDLVMASPYAGSPGYSNLGRAHIFFGGAFSGTNDADTDADILIDGLTRAPLSNIASVGDHDGDGYDDLAIGSWYYRPAGTSLGAVFLFTGPLSAGSYDAGDRDAVWHGNASMCPSGATAVGDVDGDGYDDLIARASSDDTAARDAGAAYLILGSPAPSDGAVTAQAATILGRADYDGYPYGAAGMDMDGDGYSDILGTCNQVDTLATDSGCMYVTWGPVSGTRYADETSLMICGTDSYDNLGYVAVPGDVDGDGVDDLSLTATGHDTSYSGAGAVYLFFEVP